jgi:uncharacterized protein (DUF488 family)
MSNTKLSTIKHKDGKGATLDYQEEKVKKKKGTPIYLIGDAKPNYMANTEIRKIHIGSEDTKDTVKKLVRNAKNLRPLDMSVINEEQIPSNMVSGRDS